MVIKLFISAATALALLSAPAHAASSDDATARRFSNCTQLNKTYAHGVGRPGARDHTSGVPVTNFTRNATVYRQNSGSDRDKDGIACEKR